MPVMIPVAGIAAAKASGAGEETKKEVKDAVTNLPIKPERREKIAVQDEKFTGPLTKNQMIQLGLPGVDYNSLTDVERKQYNEAKIKSAQIKGDVQVEAPAVPIGKEPGFFSNTKEAIRDIGEYGKEVIDNALDTTLSQRKKVVTQAIIDKVDQKRQPTNELKDLFYKAAQTVSDPSKYQLEKNIVTASGEQVGDNVETDWHYYPRFTPNGLENAPIIIKNANFDEVLNIAMAADKQQIAEGAPLLSLYTQDDTFHRAVLQGKGDWKSFIGTIERNKPKDFNRIRDGLYKFRDDTDNTRLQNMSDETIDKIASYATYLPMAGKIVYGTGINMLAIGPASLLDLFTGEANLGTAMLADTLNAVDKTLNLKDDQAVRVGDLDKLTSGVESNPAIKFIVPTNQTFYNAGTTSIDVSDKSGFNFLNVKEITKGYENRVERDLLTRFINLRGFNLSLTTAILGVGKNVTGAKKFTDDLYKETRENMLAKTGPGGKKLYNSVDDIPADEFYKQSRIVLGKALSKARENNKSKFKTWIQNEINKQAFAWKSNPKVYWKDLKKTIGSESLLEAVSTYYITDSLRDEGKDKTAFAIDFMFGITGATAGYKLQEQVVDRLAIYGLKMPLDVVSKSANMVGLGSGVSLIFKAPGIKQLVEFADGRGTIEGLTTAQSNSLKRLGKTLIRVSENDPDVLEKMEQSFTMMKGLYKEMLDVGFEEKDIHMTLGMMFNIEPLRVLEHKLIQQAGDKPTADANYYFLETANKVASHNRNFETAINKMLFKLSDKMRTAGTETSPELNTLFKTIKNTTKERMEEIKVFEDVLREEVQLRYATLLEDDSLSANSVELLNGMEGSPFLPDVNSTVQDTATNIKNAQTEAKQAVILANRGLQYFKQKTMQANNIIDKNVKTQTSPSGEVLSPEVTSQTKTSQIKVLTTANETATKLLENMFDIHRLQASGLVSDTLKNVPDNVSQIDANKLIQEISFVGRTNDKEASKTVKGLINDIEFEISFVLKDKINDALGVVANSTETSLKEAKKDIEDLAKSLRTPDEKGPVTDAEVMRVLQDPNLLGSKFENLPDFDFKLRYKDMYQIKNTVAKILRTKPEMQGLGTQLKNVVDSSMEEARQNILKSGVENAEQVVSDLRHVDKFYKQNYADRVNESKFYQQFANAYSTVSGKIKNKTATAKEMRDQMENVIDTELPIIKLPDEIRRPLPPELNNFFNKFMELDAVEQDKELRAMFGIPEEKTVTTGQKKNVYRYPNKNDGANYTMFKAFTNMYDTYVATTIAKKADEYTEKGADVFEQRVNSLKPDDDEGWDRVLYDIEFGFTGGAKGDNEVSNIIAKYNVLNEKSGGAAGGLRTDHMENVANLSSINTRHGQNIQAGLKKLMKDLKLRTGEKIKIKEKQRKVLNALETVRSASEKISGSVSLVQQMMKAADGTGRVDFLEEAKKVYVNSGESAEDFDNVIREHVAHGVVMLNARTKDGYRIVDGGGRTDSLEDIQKEGGNAYRREEVSIGEEGLEKPQTGFKAWKNKTGYFADQGTTKLEIVPDIEVNGADLLSNLNTHQLMFKNYMKQDALKAAMVIAKITTVKNADVGDGMLRSPIEGLPKMKLASWLSRIYAVAGKRVSAKYVMTEASYVFMKNREADAMISLLLSPKEAVGPLAKMLATGRVDKRDVNPAVLEAIGTLFVARALGGYEHIYEGHAEQHNDLSDPEKIVKAMQRLMPDELDPVSLFPSKTVGPSITVQPFGNIDLNARKERRFWDDKLIGAFRVEMEKEDARNQKINRETGKANQKASFMELMNRARGTILEKYYPFSP